MSDDLNKIPAAFWGTLTDKQFRKIATTGWLNARLCARLWRMTDHNSTPPKRLQVLIKREDVERLIKS